MRARPEVSVALLLLWTCAFAAVEEKPIVWCDEGRWDSGVLRSAIRQWNATAGVGAVVYNGVALDSHSGDYIEEAASELLDEDDAWAGGSSSGWILDDLRRGDLAQCDIYLARSSAVPLFFDGHLKELSVVRNDPRFEWDKIAYPARSYVGEFGYLAVSVPLEFQFPMLLYRRDFVFYPPADWEDLLDMAERLNSTDLNGDGVPDFAFCVDPAPHFGQLAFGIVASIMKADRSIFTAAMYDINIETASVIPMFDTPGYAYAFSIARRMWQLSRGDNWDAPRSSTSDRDWELGKCAFYLTWAAEGGSSAERNSYVRGRSGFAMMPGSTKVYSRATKKLEKCNMFDCPFSRSALAQPINQITFEVGSKRLIVRHNVSNLKVVVDILAAVVKAMPPWSEGIVPSRERDFLNFTEYTDHGWDPFDAFSYLAAVQNSLSNPVIHSTRLYPTSSRNYILFRHALGKALRVSTRPEFAAYNGTDEQIARELAEDMDTNMRRMGYTPDNLMPGWLRNQSYSWTIHTPASPEPQGKRITWIWVAVLLLLLAITVACVAALSQYYRSRLQLPASSTDATAASKQQEQLKAQKVSPRRQGELEIVWPSLPSRGAQDTNREDDDADKESTQSGSSSIEMTTGSQGSTISASDLEISGLTPSNSTAPLHRKPE